MDRKQVIVVSLLLVAIVLSTASVMMNVSVLDSVEITQTTGNPDNGNLKLVIESTPENSLGGSSNG